MKYFRHTLFLALLSAPLIAGCDAVDTPLAIITGVDATLGESNDFIEIQDVSGFSYGLVETLPASVDIPLFSDEVDYFVVVIRSTDDGYSFVAASDAFRTGDLSGTSFTTSGDVEAVLTFE